MKTTSAIYIGPTVKTPKIFLNFGMTGQYQHCSGGGGFRGFGFFKADGYKTGRYVLRSELFIQGIDT
jgi:hypothetical protein